MPRDPKCLPADPKFCGEFESELRSGFRARNGELKGSGVTGMDGDKSPFRGARPKLTSYSDSPYPKPHSTHFLKPTGIFGRIYRTEQYFGPGRGCCFGRKPVRFGKSAKKYPWVPRKKKISAILVKLIWKIPFVHFSGKLGGREGEGVSDTKRL